MSGISPNLLIYYGYDKMSPERRAIFEASLHELGFCIRATALERVGTYNRRLGYAITEEEFWSQ
jgi:hypothetical protein